MWLSQPVAGESSQEGFSQAMPVKGVDGSCPDLYQDVAVFGNWFLHLFELKDIRRSIVWVQNGFHLTLLSRSINTPRVAVSLSDHASREATPACSLIPSAWVASRRYTGSSLPSLDVDALDHQPQGD